MRNLAPLFRIIGPILLALLPAVVSGQSGNNYATPYAITTLAGTTSGGHDDGVDARFYRPADVAVDAAGNFYIADTGNQTIRKRSSNGTVTTLAGLANVAGAADGVGSAARFAAPSGIAVDSGGNLYVADRDTHIIRKISAAGAVTTLAGTGGSAGSTDGSGAAARFNSPVAVAVDASGNVYVADLGNYTIRKITPAGLVSTIAGSPGQTGAADGAGANARFNGPEGLAVDPAGNLYVADTAGSSIRKISPAGDVSTFASLSNPTGIALDPAGNLIVSCRNGIVRKVSPVGGVTFVAGDPNQIGTHDGNGSTVRFSALEGIALDAAGNAYVADRDNNAIRKITPDATVTTFVGASLTVSFGYVDATGPNARFGRLSDLAVDTAGNVFVADPDNHCVRKVTPAGAVTTYAGSPGNIGSADGAAAIATFVRPAGIAVDAAGNVYVADADYCVIRKISTAGIVSTIAGSALVRGSADGVGAAARFSGPCGLKVDAAGNVFVVDGLNNSVRKISPTGVVTTVFSRDTSPEYYLNRFGATNLALDPAGSIFICDSVGNLVLKLTPGGALSPFAGSYLAIAHSDGTGPDARFDYITGIATDGNGNVYVVDRLVGLVRRISPAAVVTTIAGSVTNESRTDGAGQDAGFYAPYAIVADAAGTIYVTDDGSIRKGRLATAPVITTQPQSASATAGGSAQFTVSASGAPDPTYQWYFNGSVFSGGTGSTLSLANVRSTDGGDYTVVVTNALGNVTSAKATLTVTASTAPTPSGGSSGGGGGGGGGAPSTGFVLALLLVVTARAIKGRAMGPERG